MPKVSRTSPQQSILDPDQTLVHADGASSATVEARS